MLPRVVLAVSAVLVLGWLGVLLRDERVGTVAAHRLFYEPGLPRAEQEHELGRLRDAKLLNPDIKWEIRRISYLVAQRRMREAADATEALARQEPDNIDLWSTLYKATAGWDARRAAWARREVIRLNPLGARPPAVRAGRGATPAGQPPAP